MLIYSIMNLLRLVIIMLFLGAFAEEISKPGTVNIGAIFTLATINGGVAKIAMDAAVQDVNSDPSFLSGRRLNLFVHDSNCSGFLSIGGGKYSNLSIIVISLDYFIS